MPVAIATPRRLYSRDKMTCAYSKAACTAGTSKDLCSCQKWGRAGYIEVGRATGQMYIKKDEQIHATTVRGVASLADELDLTQNHST